MSGEQFFKFNNKKDIDFTSFNLKLDSTNDAENKKNELFSIFDTDGNNIIDKNEITELFSTFTSFANIKDDTLILDSDEAELMLSFIADSNGKKLKDKGFTVGDLFDFIKDIQNTGQKNYEKKQEKYFESQVNIVRNSIVNFNLEENVLTQSYKDVEAYARALTGLQGKKELTEKEAEKLTKKIIELQLINDVDFKYTQGAKVYTKGKKFTDDLLKTLKDAGITPNAETHGIFLNFVQYNKEEQAEMIKLIKKYNVKTGTQFQNAIQKQRSLDLQDYAAEVLIGNIQSAIDILQQTEDNMGVSFETASEYIKKGIYALSGWDRAKPVSEAKKEMVQKLQHFKTQLNTSIKNGTFKQTFKKLTGTAYDEKKIEEFIKFSAEQEKKSIRHVQSGEIGAMHASLDNLNYQMKMKDTFGIDFTNSAQNIQFHSADDGAGLELIAMIAMMAKFSSSAAGRGFTSSVYNTAARVLPKGMARIATSSLTGGITLGAFTGTTQIVRNLTKKSPTTRQDWENTGWAALQSFGFGAFAGAFGASAGKWVTEKSFEGFSKVLKNTKFMKTNTQALSKVSANLNKLSAGGSMKAADIIKTLQSASAPEFAAHAIGFAAEIGGCTGYAALIEQPIKDMYNNGGFDESSIRAAMYQACSTPEEIEHVKKLSGAELVLEYTQEKLGEQAEMLTKVKGISTIIGAVIGGKFAQFSMLNSTEIKKTEVNGKQMFEIKTPLAEKPIIVESPEMVTFVCKQIIALDIAKNAELNEGVNEGVNKESGKSKPQAEKSVKGSGDKPKNRHELEGGIQAEELTEAAPFARHLSPYEVTDPIEILSKNLDARANSANFDLTQYETTGLPLKYSRQEFTQKLKMLVNDMKIEDQQKILEKFNINLIYTEEGFELKDIPKILQDFELKTPLEREIKAEIERFTKENEFKINNPEMKVFLDDFVQIAPEFLLTVGKQQHGTHAYTLDVHTLKVLQNAIEHPEYQNLSPQDKMVLNTAILLHDIGKRYIDPKTADQDHAENSYNHAIDLLDRFNLPSDIKQRVVKLIENHEFFKQYNEMYTSFKYEQDTNAEKQKDFENYGWKYTPETGRKETFDKHVQYTAGKFVNIQDFTLAKILTYSDLKSVNPEQTFVQNKWNNKTRTNEDAEYKGFDKMVTKTQTDAEFKEYIDESLSYVEKELSKYQDGKIDEELVYPSELVETSNKLFGYTSFFDRIKRSQNQSYGVHRSDYEFCIQTRQMLINRGFKPKKAVKILESVLKYKDNNFDKEATSEFLQTYLENRNFINSHNLRYRDYKDKNEMTTEINLIKQKEARAKTFKEFGVKDENLQKRLSNTLYIEEYQKGTFFNQEAYDAMVELFKTNKYTPEEINKIIHNSFSIKNHRGCFRDNRNCNSEFNRQIMDTILELSREEPLENAIRDAHLCFDSAAPESGWVLVPEFLDAVKEFNKLGVKDKRFLWSLFDRKFKDNADKYNPNRILESVTKNEKYERALEYAKQGFEGDDLSIIINTYEIREDKIVHPKEIQDKIAELVKRGVYEEYHDCGHITRQLFDGSSDPRYQEDYRFNHENYNFMIRMLDTGIKAKQLDAIVYQSSSSDFHAREAAPDKIIEPGRFSKAQIEAMVNFFKEIGFDKIPYSSTDDLFRNLAESFMDVVELTPEESTKMVDSDCFGNIHKISKMNDYMAPFKYLNVEKYNQALSYYKRGVNIGVLKELTAKPELYENLKSESDLSYIKTSADAQLIANFWEYRNIKSIDELSHSQRMELMTRMMINKTAFENNNVSAKIPLLPTTSESYAQAMKDFAHSFGYDKTPYTSEQAANINTNFTNLTQSLQNLNLQNAGVERIISDIQAIIPELKIDTQTLQRVVKSPEFNKLSDKDKSILTFAALFSNVKTNPLDAAIEASVYAKRMGMSDTDAMKIYTIIKNSKLTDTFMSQQKQVKVNDSRSYATILSTQLDEIFETAAMELKNYNNFQMAKMLYTANENYLSSDMLKEFAPDLYQEFLNIRQNVSTPQEALKILSKNPAHTNRLEAIKIQAAEKYAPSRHLSRILENEIQRIKVSDVLLPQTDIQSFIKNQSSEWIETHTKIVNGRKVLVISSNEIPDFYHLSHTTQAFGITGKADAETNISNFEAFAMLFDNKTVCLSYSAAGKTAVVGNTGLLIRTDNTSQYLARGTDISSIAKDIPAMVSEYISRRAQIDQRGFQSKRTKDFDRLYFASMIKEEMQPGYRELLNKKLELEENIRNGNTECQRELAQIDAQMKNIDNVYAQKIDALIKKADGKTIDIQFIRENDAELGAAYDRVLSYINTEHRGDAGLMRTEYHNEVLASNTAPVGIFVTSEKTLFELTDEYLRKAEENKLPIVILK